MTTHHSQIIDHHEGDEDLCNLSKNSHLNQVIERRMSRRHLLKGALSSAMLGFISPAFATTERPAFSAQRLGFEAVKISSADQVIVPKGYQVQTLIPFDSPLPHPTEKNLKIGSHHDGMHFYPIHQGHNEGLLVLNHEYVEPRFMHPHYHGLTLSANAIKLNQQGLRPLNEVKAEMAAHGVSVVHIKRNAQGEWQTVEDKLNRRIDATTTMFISGPVRGHDLVKTAFSPEGTSARGTLNNCAHGVTPWGTYLTCEENWAGYFYNPGAQPREQSRYGIRKEKSSRYAWEKTDSHDSIFTRFHCEAFADSAEHDYRNEPNTFGWVVEIDPFNPESTPIKRTALGRFAHEGVVFQKPQAGQPIVCYMGDDARFEYLYKYVSDAPFQPGQSGGELLDQGTLYAARFHDNGKGEWLALTFGQGLLTPAHGFHSQAEVLVNTRLAADLVGATKMDRPEWGAVHPHNGEVYFTLTNNHRRTEEQTDQANPRAQNRWGHIIRWRESTKHALEFDWDIFLLAGDEQDSAFANQSLDQTNKFNSPDGLWFDLEGRLWIQTDMSESVLNQGDWEQFGNNQMLVCDPLSQTIKRFLVGPVGQEISGITSTPDGKTLFVNVQHPGATTRAEDYAKGEFTSHWPQGQGTPRSATLVISKRDQGIIGT
jgi:secreted PhoX family phosphatase